MLPRVESEIFKKVKLSLCLTKHHAMKAYRGSAGITPRIFGLGARWGEWSASRPGHFTPKERAPQYPLYRKLGGPQSRSGRGGEEKNSQPPLEIEP
jgi:hypothetical protein